MLEVLDPVGVQHLEVKGLVRPPASLKGKTLGLLDNSGSSAMGGPLEPNPIYKYMFERLQADLGLRGYSWVAKPNACAPAPGSQIDQIATTSDAAITGLAV